MNNRPVMVRLTNPNGNEFVVSPAHVTGIECFETTERWKIRIHTIGGQQFTHLIRRDEWPADMEPLVEVAGILGYDTMTPVFDEDALPGLGSVGGPKAVS